MKGLRFYPTCKLISWPAIFHGCWQKTQNSWVTKDFITHGTAGSRMLGLSWLPLPPKSHGASVDSLGGFCTVNVCMSQLKKPEWKEPKYCIMGLLVNLPQLCSRERHNLYNIGQQTNLLSAPEGTTVFIFWICMLSKHPWRDSPEWKLSEPLCLRHAKNKNRNKQTRPTKNCLTQGIMCWCTNENKKIPELIFLLQEWARPFIR